MQTRHAVVKKTCQLDDSPVEDACSYDGDKENAANAATPKPKSKRKGGTGKKGLSKRRKLDNVTDVASQESPPSFVFKAAKTSFRQRKLLKHEKQLQQEEANKKRIEELVAYFKNLDEQKLETA